MKKRRIINILSFILKQKDCISIYKERRIKTTHKKGKIWQIKEISHLSECYLRAEEKKTAPASMAQKKSHQP